MTGLLIAFEGLDQSGKQTQAEILRDRLFAAQRSVQLLSFPDYSSAIGAEIGKALRGERDYGPDVMQLLYVANRYESKRVLQRALDAGTVVVCDRYLASSVAYGEAHGVDPDWLLDVQRYLPQPHVTFFLDIPPEASARRKTDDRDKFERDLALLERVRQSYMRQSVNPGWIRLNADRNRRLVAEDVYAEVVKII